LPFLKLYITNRIHTINITKNMIKSKKYMKSFVIVTIVVVKNNIMTESITDPNNVINGLT